MFVAMLWMTASGQSYVSINMPNHLCAGAERTITFGHQPGNNAQIYQPHTTMSQAGRAFLPDGIPCGTMGCSYRSTVTFTDFDANSSITSVQDIKYVRLNIEHSWIGDIYIGITCPNQQTASLMNYGGSGSASCLSSIPSSHRGWSTTATNVSTSTYLGNPIDQENSTYKCDSTATGNQPGTGWNYCWSNNTTSGFSYASGDGIIYRSGHSHNGRIDSSNVAAHTNFYKPNQNFSSLIGCPLNGQWYIEVMDGWSGDNGYIFGWELALDPALIPQPCHLIGRDILGNGITKINDSTYRLNVPENIESDSTMEFLLRMVNDCGDTIDSLMSIAVHPHVDTAVNDTACDRYAWGNGYITDSRMLVNNLHTRYQCDSTVNIALTVLQSTADTLVDTVVENQLPYSICGVQVNHSVSDTVFQFTNAVGCDSLYHFTLTVWPNVDTILDSVVCAHQLPIIWGALTFDSASIKHDTLLNIHGADSVLVMRLGVKPDDTVYVVDTLVENSLPYHIAGTMVDGACVDTTFLLTSQNGCDSLIHLALHVWPNVDTVLDTVVCRHQLPITWEGLVVYDIDTVSVLLATANGADSTVYMQVAVLADDTVYRNDTIVENTLPYSIEGGFVFGSDADTALLLENSEGCDSTVHYKLKVWRNVETSYDTTVCDNVWPLDWRGYHFLGGGQARVNTYTMHGADSTVTLYVAINPVYDTILTPEICDNGSYNLGPLTLNHSGHYEHTFASVDGCDSLVQVNLTVWPTYKIDHYDTACLSEGIDVGGVRYYESGVLPHMYTTVQGCDSLVTHFLTIKGLYLQARAHVSPEIVTPGNLDVSLADISRAAIDRLWLIGDDFQSTEEEFVYTYPDEHDTVPLYLIVYSDDGCTDTVHRILQIDRTAIYVPNVFTPSLESNSRWFIYAQDLTDMEVWIYNRQGNLVYHYLGADGYWDGTSDGKDCPQGAYVFKAEYHSRVYPDRQQSITGTILLLR